MTRASIWCGCAAASTRCRSAGAWRASCVPSCGYKADLTRVVEGVEMQLLRRQSVRRKARPDCLDHSRRSRSVHLEWRERREVSEDGLMHKSGAPILLLWHDALRQDGCEA